jgi:hypothetical protein
VRRATNLVRRADGWVFAVDDARRLAAVRVGLCSVLAVRFAVIDYRAAALRRHGARFHPLTYMQLFDHMPSPDAATALRACGIVAALLAAAGLALRISLPLAFACSLVLNGMLNSTGRVIVGDAVLTLCLLVLLACGPAAGEAWSLHGTVRRGLPWFRDGPGEPQPTRVTTQSERYGWPVRTAMLAVALAYFFAGFQKWRYSGLAWVTSDNLRWILYGQAHPNGIALFIADRPTLAHAFAAGALLLETCFPLVLFLPRLRWLVIPSVAAMHIGIRFAIGLDYSTQWLTAVIVFANWPALADRVRQLVPPFSAAHQTAR